MLTLWKVDTTERVSSIFIEHHVSHKVQDGIPYAKHCQSLAKTYAINQSNIWIPPFHRKKLNKGVAIILLPKLSLLRFFRNSFGVEKACRRK